MNLQNLIPQNAATGAKTLTPETLKLSIREIATTLGEPAAWDALRVIEAAAKETGGVVKAGYEHGESRLFATNGSKTLTFTGRNSPAEIITHLENNRA